MWAIMRTHRKASYQSDRLYNNQKENSILLKKYHSDKYVSNHELQNCSEIMFYLPYLQIELQNAG